jgi:hypothetical protein
MYAFLRMIYERTESDQLGVLLGGMSLLQDGGTADPAVWHDWEAAVRKARADEVNLGLNLRDD